MKARILVVDDEESIREFLEIMLKKEGYEVTLAEDGKRAQEILKKKSFDMIISDLQMPHVTGLELLKYVKDQDSDMVFMIITAFGTTETGSVGIPCQAGAGRLRHSCDARSTGRQCRPGGHACQGAGLSGCAQDHVA